MNVTRSFCNALAPPLRVATAEECVAALKSNLLCPIPVPSFSLLPRDTIPSDLAPDFCAPHAMFEINDVSFMLQSYITLPLNVNTDPSEISWSTFHSTQVEMLFTLLAKNCLIQLPVQRNCAAPDSSTSIDRLRSRPDLTVRTYLGVLLLLAEEKRSREDMNAAVRDVLQKVPIWNPLVMGPIPFLLCYTTAGSLVHFWVMDTQRNLHQVFPDPLNLMEPQHRFQFFRTIVNCFRIARANQSEVALPPYSYGLYQRVNRPYSGCTLEFRGSSVVKEYRNKRTIDAEFAADGGFTPGRLDHLNAIFSALKSSAESSAGPKYLEYPKAISNLRPSCSYLRVEMVPLGFSQIPETEPDFCRAIRCVLSGLQELHSIGWLHGDVRWPNVLRRGPDGDWFLIDYDRAQPINARQTATADLVLVVQHLFKDLRFELSAIGRALCAALPTLKTAGEALKHAWFVPAPQDE